MLKLLPKINTMEAQQNLELEKLNDLNRHQFSNVVYFDNEVKYLKTLLHKYFMSMISEIHIEKVQQINSKLSQLNMINLIIEKDVRLHQNNLQIEVQNIDFLQTENLKVEEEINDLNKCFRSIRREIFIFYRDISTDNLAKAFD